MRVKNWHKFQHFKDRSPPWIKFYRDLLDDIEWHNLNAQAAKVLVMLWLIASEDKGALPPIKTLAFRLRLPESQVKTIVSQLSHWLEQDDISQISEQHRGDGPEGEREKEKEKERETEGPRKRGAHALPADFVLTDAIRFWCDTNGYDNPQASLDYMRDWAKSGDKRKTDWDATLRNCIKGDWGKARELARKNPKAVQQAPPKHKCVKCGDLCHGRDWKGHRYCDNHWGELYAADGDAKRAALSLRGLAA